MPDCRPDVRISSSLPKVRVCALRLAGDRSLHVTPPVLLRQTYRELLCLQHSICNKLNHENGGRKYENQIQPLKCSVYR